jgi:hypothetical protein
MKRFGYWRDPLFLLCCALYVLNRWFLKPHLHSGFLHGQFNDLLLIPCALPLVLWLQRKLGLRRHDLSPSIGEIVGHLLIWSVLFEAIGPRVLHVTGDPLDVLAYFVGGASAALWWNIPPLRRASLQ